MLKLLAKVAEKYAKSTNTACFAWGLFHQPKMPASLIKKDQYKQIPVDLYNISLKNKIGCYYLVFSTRMFKTLIINF